MKFTVNDTEYEIQTIVHHKQCDAYYETLKEKDGCKAHMLWIAPTRLPQYLIDSKIRIIMLKEEWEAERKRIDEMSTEMLEIEIKLGANRCFGK